MSGPRFFQTGMGQKFFEHTLPELVRQLTRLNDHLGRIVALLEERSRGGDAETPKEPKR
jgi:hypothetical protein